MAVNSSIIPREQPTLADGYYFASRQSLIPEEIIRLRKSEGWDGDTPGGWQKLIESSLILVGIRAIEHQLVAMGRVAGDTRHAALCDAIVDPAHRRRGLGKAMLLERMRLAEEIGIIYMYTERKSTNVLGRTQIYNKLGFVATGNGMFRIAPE